MDAADSGPSLARSDTKQADADLERRIEDARTQMMAAQTTDCVRHWADEMTRLINSRGPERIREMELARGLR
jgi:hypothetical protein